MPCLLPCCAFPGFGRAKLYLHPPPASSRICQGSDRHFQHRQFSCLSAIGAHSRFKPAGRSFMNCASSVVRHQTWRFNECFAVKDHAIRRLACSLLHFHSRIICGSKYGWLSAVPALLKTRPVSSAGNLVRSISAHEFTSAVCRTTENGGAVTQDRRCSLSILIR